MANEKMMSGAEFKERFMELTRDLKDDDLVYFGNADLSLSRFKERGPSKARAWCRSNSTSCTKSFRADPFQALAQLSQQPLHLGRAALVRQRHIR